MDFREFSHEINSGVPASYTLSVRHFISQVQKDSLPHSGFDLQMIELFYALIILTQKPECLLDIALLFNLGRRDVYVHIYVTRTQSTILRTAPFLSFET